MLLFYLPVLPYHATIIRENTCYHVGVCMELLRRRSSVRLFICLSRPYFSLITNQSPATHHQYFFSEQISTSNLPKEHDIIHIGY
jgi:hypothetical protein